MKENKRKMVIALIVLAIPVLLFLAWVIMSPGKIRTYSEPNSLSEKYVMDINGAPNGFFINSRDINNPVLLLVSSGPGTDDYVFTDKYKDMHLEDDFTVVYWDYRWMGISYDISVRKDEIDLKGLLDDTQAVTEYLKGRFNKDKIYIMVFSGGTHIALREAQRHPEDYYAYIGMAQCVTDSSENDTLIYNFMKEVFTKRSDKNRLVKLEAAVEKKEDGSVKCRNWYDYIMLLHDAGGGTIKDKTEFEGITWPIITAKCYTVKEKINYVISMKMYRTTPLSAELDGFDYRQSLKELKVPAYFISGEYDYNCPWELVKDYNEKIKAPDKRFYLIKNSAHSPLWENPEDTCKILRDIKEKIQNG